MLNYFSDVFLPNIRPATITYKKWRQSYSGEATQWDAYLQKVQVHKKGESRPVAPALTSRFGKALVAAAEEHVSVIDLGAVWDQPTPPPPPTGTLRYRPPGYDGVGNPRDSGSFPGYVPIDASNGPETLNLTNGVDYYIRLGAKAWSSGSQRFIISGGRNVVIIGGSIMAGHYDDFGIQIDGGTLNGTVHVEGVRIDAVNGFTLRSPRYLQIQNCHVTLSSTVGSHSDVVQVWMNGGKSPGIRIHRLTCYSDFSFLSDFTDEPSQSPFGRETPAYWELYDIDMHSTYIGNWMGNPPSCLWRGSNCWLETSTEASGNRRRLGDQLRHFGLQYTPMSAAFQYFDANNNLLFTSVYNPTNGYAPGEYGRAQGHRMRYQSGFHPLLANMEWRCQKPTQVDGADANGNFVPASMTGVNYVSPGYL